MTRPCGRDLGAVGVDGEDFGEPGFVGGGVDAVEFVGGGFVGAEDAEVGHVALHDVAQEAGEGGGGRDVALGVTFCVDGVVAEVGHLERLAQNAAVGVRIGGDAAVAFGCELL